MTRPEGRGLELLTLTNWSLCKSTVSATKAVMGTGKDRFFADCSAAIRCCPSTINAGFFPDVPGVGISMVPTAVTPSSVFGPLLFVNFTDGFTERTMALGKIGLSLSR